MSETPEETQTETETESNQQSDIEKYVSETVEEARDKLRMQGYEDIECAAETATLETLRNYGYDELVEWPEPLAEAVNQRALQALDTAADWEWRITADYDEERMTTHLYLDADPCPVCGAEVINGQIRESGQWVATSIRRRREYHADINRTLFQCDDGPHSPALVYAGCGACHAVLHDDHDDRPTIPDGIAETLLTALQPRYDDIRDAPHAYPTESVSEYQEALAWVNSHKETPVDDTVIARHFLPKWLYEVAAPDVAWDLLAGAANTTDPSDDYHAVLLEMCHEHLTDAQLEELGLNEQ